MSLRVQLTAAFFLVICLTLGLVVTALDRAVQQDYLHTQEVAQLAQANILATAMEFDLIRYPVRVSSMVKEFAREIHSRVVVTDSNGIVIADAFDDPKLQGDVLNITEVQGALRGKQEAGNRLLQDGTWTMYAAVPITFNRKLLGTVLISHSLEEVQEAIQSNRWRLGAAVLIPAMAGVIVSLGIASLLTNRIAMLTQAAERVGAGSLDETIDIGGGDEIAKLGHTFNQMVKRLRNAEEMRKQFFSDAAHELRTPVSAIKALSEPLAFGPELEVTVYKEFAGDIHEQGERLSQLVDELLQVSMLDQIGALDKQRFDLSEIARRAGKQVAPLASQKNIDLHYETSKIWIIANKAKLTQVLVNLLHNSIKCTPQGGRVELKMIPKGEGVSIVVADTGIGIPQEEQQRIFQRFYRVEKSRNRRQGGTGLGLAIVKRIVDLHEGTIEIMSREGKGTKITVWLPNRLTFS